MESAAAQNLAIRNLYAKVEKVGEGTYASVFLARNVKTGQKVAIKKIKIVSNENGMDVTAIREVKFLKELNHPNVIKVRVQFATFMQSISPTQRPRLTFRLSPCSFLHAVDGRRLLLWLLLTFSQSGARVLGHQP